MTESDRQPCPSCGHPTLPATLKATGGFCRKCKPPQGRVAPSVSPESEAPAFSGKYDDASWHYGGTFPAELPPENGATHIAMFLAWANTRDLLGEFHTEEAALRSELAEMKQRAIDPRAYLLSNCDGKLTDEDFNDEGNRFALAYYASNRYFDDLAATFPETGSTIYFLENSWRNYERVFAVLDTRHQEWKARAEQR